MLGGVFVVVPGLDRFEHPRVSSDQVTRELHTAETELSFTVKIWIRRGAPIGGALREILPCCFTWNNVMLLDPERQTSTPQLREFIEVPVFALVGRRD